jgi:hypothetical protein
VPSRISRLVGLAARLCLANVVYVVNEEVKRLAWSEDGSCRVCGGVWAVIGGNMRHKLFDCAACRIYDECRFEPHRWKMLMKHPFRFPRGSVAITEVMRYFGSLLNVWEQHTENRLAGIVVWSQVYSFAHGSFAQGQLPESAEKAWSREYRNQRRNVQRTEATRQRQC